MKKKKKKNFTQRFSSENICSFSVVALEHGEISVSALKDKRIRVVLLKVCFSSLLLLLKIED